MELARATELPIPILVSAKPLHNYYKPSKATNVILFLFFRINGQCEN